MKTETAKALARLLRYSMEDCFWDWTQLTHGERQAIGTEDQLEEIRQWTEHTLAPTCTCGKSGTNVMHDEDCPVWRDSRLPT